MVFIEWLEKHGHNFGPYIDGECSKTCTKFEEPKLDGKPKCTHQLKSSERTSLEFTEISVIISEDLIMKSIKSSERAFGVWKNNPNRGRILRSVCSALKSKSELFAEISLATHGICKSYSLTTDLSYAVNAFSYYGNLSDKLLFSNNQWQANGIIGCAFLDDNSPLMTLSWLSTSLLAAGNTILLLVKPHYSLISLAFATTLSEAGIPPGVLNVLPCVDSDSFPTIMDKISRFSGIIPPSIKCFPTHAHISSVLKMNTGIIPMLILTSTDVESAAQCIIDSVKIPFLTAWFINLIVVEEPIFEAFVATLKMRIDRFADYQNEHESLFQYGEYIKEKTRDGYEVLKLANDYVCCLFLINNDDAIKCPVITDELHPPVRIISVISIRTVDEAVSLVNRSTSGLAASIWTNDSGQTLSVPFKLNYGTVWVNSYGQFDVSVPFSPWNEYGFGTFSGDKVLFRNMTLSPNEINNKFKRYGLYSPERNEVFPKKDVKRAIDSAHSSFLSLHKPDLENGENFLQLTAAQLNKFWPSHYKIVLTETSEETFLKVISYVEYWATYAYDSTDETVFTKDFYVLCKKEPIGVIGILAGNMSLDALVFLICGAIANGNTVVVGVPADDKTAVLALEMENMFSLITERVTFVISDTASLWDAFLDDQRCPAVWYVPECVKHVPRMNNQLKHIVQYKLSDNMTKYADTLKLNCTKQRSIWLPKI